MTAGRGLVHGRQVMSQVLEMFHEMSAQRVAEHHLSFVEGAEFWDSAEHRENSS